MAIFNLPIVFASALFVALFSIVLCNSPPKILIKNIPKAAPPVKIVHLASGLCLTVNGMSQTQNGGVVDLWTCTGSPLQNNQRWDVSWSQALPSGGGTEIPVFQFSSLVSGKCLTVNGISSVIDQWQCMGQSNQEWIILLQKPTEWESIKIQNKKNGLCLFIASDMNAKNGARVTQTDCKSGLAGGLNFKMLNA